MIDDPVSFAKAVAARLRLFDFIEGWNGSVEVRSVVASFRDFEEALALNPSTWRVYAEARIDAKRRGIDLRGQLKRHLEAQIHDTSERFILRVVDAWALQVAASGPFAEGCEVNLPSAAAFVIWCLNNVRYPLITSPNGGRLMAYRQLRPLLRCALARHSDTAVKSGWIGIYDRSRIASFANARAQRDGVYTTAEIRQIAMTPILDFIKPVEPK